MMMKKKVLAMVVFAGLLSGVAHAGNVKKQDKGVLTASQMKSVENIAIAGNEAMQNIQLARVALFNGDTGAAKKYLLMANEKINDDKTDWKKFEKKTHKKMVIDSDGYVIINASMSVNEKFQSADVKKQTINNVNKKIEAGDKKGAIETLRLAGISVVENLDLMPLQQTRNDIQKAISLFKEGKYYQANLVLLSAEQGIIVDSEFVSE
ncbi:YfdX family protein [Escherichia coli]|uniref:YfdX family protein n=1 Tax=Escherichia coli TaxID=562 RepID=UPI001E337901|nr:YfdX family protein [Escherichia coli]